MKTNIIGFFEKYLTIWVILCMICGIIIGGSIPSIPITLSKLEYSNISIPVAILVFMMIFPMMLKINFSELIISAKQPKGLFVTLVVNWIIKPFSMYIIMSAFIYIVFKNLIPQELGTEYIAGAILLGAAPCTAMVFVWSKLTNGDAGYTLFQVAINDIIMLFAYVPIVGLLLGIGGIQIPWNTLIIATIIFVVIPLLSGFITRSLILKRKDENYLISIIKKLDSLTIVGLLLTIIIIFSFQGNKIINNPTHIILLSIPIIIQTIFIFIIAYSWSYLWKVPHCIASPSAMIGASNFFELAVAIAISLFGLNSGATLVTIVGVLVEVPIMLLLVKFSNNTKQYFK